MKIIENLQVTQPNQSQLIKVIPVQSFRGVFTTQLKILPFVYWIAKENAIVEEQHQSSCSCAFIDGFE